jgi:hypothetical protein
MRRLQQISIWTLYAVLVPAVTAVWLVSVTGGTSAPGLRRHSHGVEIVADSEHTMLAYLTGAWVTGVFAVALTVAGNASSVAAGAAHLVVVGVPAVAVVAGMSCLSVTTPEEVTRR